MATALILLVEAVVGGSDAASPNRSGELFAPGDRRSSLDDLLALIDWSEVAARLEVVHAAAKGEASWPPLAMFRALLLSVWYDLSDVKLAEALDDRASFRRFCGF